MCHRCWYEEENNKRSLRLRLFDPVTETSDYAFGKLDLIKQRLQDKEYLFGPMVLTIKNGNVCNAKCRVCHPNDSSRWIVDSQKLYELTNKNYYSVSQVEMNWSDEQLIEIVSLSKNLVRLELFGGEPTYNKKVAQLLSMLVDSGVSKNITIYINTNGSVDIGERMPMLTEFKFVEIGVSLDGVGKHFNYIRHGCDYDEVLTNIQRWKTFFERNNVPYSIDSISTVEILNVFYLRELRDAVTEILPLPPFWNLLTFPSYLFIKNMPDTIKHAVLDKLPDAEDLNEIRNVIQQPADMQAWSQFLEVTNALDTIRSESFSETFPEFAEIIRKAS